MSQLKMIVETQGGSPRADYGEGLIKELSVQLTKDFGKGFDVTNLRKMRQFYMLFPKRDTLWRELSWSHYSSIEVFSCGTFVATSVIRYD